MYVVYLTNRSMAIMGDISYIIINVIDQLCTLHSNKVNIFVLTCGRFIINLQLGLPLYLKKK